MSARGMTRTVLATELMSAIKADGSDVTPGFGAHVNTWLNEVATELAAPPQRDDFAILRRALAQFAGSTKPSQHDRRRAYAMLQVLRAEANPPPSTKEKPC